MSERRGFTLLELLMVVVIIAILAAIALPQYIRTTERARMSEAVAMLGSLRNSQIRFKAETGNYTTNAAQLDVDSTDVAGTPQFTYTVDAVAGFPIIATRVGGAVANCKANYKLQITAAGAITGRDCQTN